MHSDKLPEPGHSPAQEVRAKLAASIPLKQETVMPGRDSSKYERACDEYETTHAEYLGLVGEVRAATGDRNAATTAALAGLVIAGLATTTAGWTMGLIVTMGCGAFATRQQIALGAARDACQAAIRKMYMAYRFAKKEGKWTHDLPSRPDQTCP